MTLLIASTHTHARAMQGMFAQVPLKPFSVCNCFTPDKKNWRDRMSSEVLRFLEHVFLIDHHGVPVGRRGDVISPFKLWFMLSACPLIACVCCLSDIGDFEFIAWIWIWSFGLLAIYAFLPPLLTFYFIAFLFHVVLCQLLYFSMGCIESSVGDGRILACLPLTLMVLACIAWGGSSAELHCGPHKWSPMIPRMASLYAPNGIKPNDLRPIVRVVCFLPWRPRSLLPTMDEDIPAGYLTERWHYFNLGSCRFHC